METQIIQKNKNPFLNREEMLIEIKSDSAPSFESIKKAIGKENDLTIIKKVHSNFGKKRFIAEVFVYGTMESKNRTETLSRKTRDKIKEEQKASFEAARKAKAEAKKVQETPIANTA